jgi:uncharacterized metal-binding protein YceD (DUF177 family)
LRGGRKLFIRLTYPSAQGKFARRDARALRDPTDRFATPSGGSMTQEQAEILALNRLPRGAPHELLYAPAPESLPALAAELGLGGLRKLRLTGRLVPEGARDWRLEGALGATVTQACVITAEPVTTRLDEPVLRRYVADMPAPEAEEMEMPEDDSLEPLPDRLDLRALTLEALALALPQYPRAPGAALGSAVFAAPGVAPMTDEDAKPLAGLAALKARMAQAEENGDDGEAAQDPDQDSDGAPGDAPEDGTGPRG